MNFASAGYPFTHGGANGIEYDKHLNRLYIVTGEKFSWLNTPNMTYDQVTNDIAKIMFPNPVETFSKFVRVDNTGADPISFVYKACNHGTNTNDLWTCFYVVTYNAGTKSSTVYRLNSIDTGYNLRLLEKFEGLGNVKQMCYWWG